jgi:hypothetical protein
MKANLRLERPLETGRHANRRRDLKLNSVTDEHGRLLVRRCP